MRPSLLVAVVPALLLGSACAAFGEAPSEDLTTRSGVDDLTRPPTPPATALSSTTPAAPPADPVATCKAATTRESCERCCGERPPSYRAEEDANDRAWNACACAPTRCAAACAGDCDPERLRSFACAECLTMMTDPCDAAYDEADAKLRARNDIGECLAASSCMSKP